jgi:hypothetical protein
VGLLELTSSGKGTLIPIAILVDGKFYDASVYKADPVPMALDSGTVYEAEQAGDSQGLFTIRGALHSQNPGNPHPWLGSGSYLKNGTEVAKTTHKAEDVPVGLDSSAGDDRPRLTRHDAAKPAAADSTAKPAPASNSPAAAGSSEKPAATAPPASSQPASGSSAGTSSGQDAQKPATASASDKPADQGAKEQASKPAQTTPVQAGSAPASSAQPSPGQASSDQASSGQASENYYRPTLRRGKPTESAPEEDEPAVKAGKPGSVAASAGGSKEKEPVQLLPAISDAGGPDPRSYAFFWKTGEEEERRNQMLALAADELRAYVNMRAQGAVVAKPTTVKAKAASQKPTAKPAQPVFENIQFHALDVWVNNQPVMILSAEGHIPPAPGAPTAVDSYSVTLVTRTDIYGNLRKLYSGVTDKFHLDVTPRLELIDAVDADGDGRGELLFRETTDAGSGYVIYRPTGDRLWKMFDSLGEE